MAGKERGKKYAEVKQFPSGPCTHIGAELRFPALDRSERSTSGPGRFTL
jgi:hypothetical protein